MKKNKLFNRLAQHCTSLSILIFILCIGFEKADAQNTDEATKPKTSGTLLRVPVQKDLVKQESPKPSIINFLKSKNTVTKINTQVVNGTTYTFIGKGDWNSASNWENGLIPPATLKPGDHVIIDGSGACLLNDSKPFLVSKESSVEIKPGKELYITIGNNFILKGNLANDGKLTVVSGTLITGFAHPSELKNTGQLKTTGLSKIDDKKILPKELKKD